MASENLCPNCKHKNEDAASVCSSCGASLEGIDTKLVAIAEYTTGGQANVQAADAAAFMDDPLIPEDGVAIYIAGEPKPYYVSIGNELILGRQMEATSEVILDLSDLNAINMGVSRRHAMIRRIEFGFEVIDLSSRNGTWLNSRQIIPNKPYPFASGSQIQLGRMELFIVYHVVANGAQKK